MSSILKDNYYYGPDIYLINKKTLRELDELLQAPVIEEKKWSDYLYSFYKNYIKPTQAAKTEPFNFAKEQRVG